MLPFHDALIARAVEFVRDKLSVLFRPLQYIFSDLAVRYYVDLVQSSDTQGHNISAIFK